MRYVGIICILGLFVSGCIVTKVHTMPVQAFNAPYDEVWDGTISYLEKEEEPILTADKQKGVISTDWVIMEKVFSVKRYRYDIQIVDTGERIEVGIVSPQEAYSMGDWEEILPTERRARRMFKAIVEGIKTAPGVSISGKISDRPFNRRQRGPVRDIP